MGHMTDTQYTEWTLTEVNKIESGWDIHDGSAGLWIPAVEGVEPKVGDKARLFGRGFGYPVRGVSINGEVVYYRTPEQEKAYRDEQLRKHDHEMQQKAEELRPRMDADYAALPTVFQRRIDRFRTGNPDFRWKYESYEMMCCTQAVIFANRLRSAEAIEDFHDAPFEQQKEMIPELDDGHSGNSFGCACHLARLYLTNPELVVQDHGAMVPLVGCEEYGCTH